MRPGVALAGVQSLSATLDYPASHYTVRKTHALKHRSALSLSTSCSHAALGERTTMLAQHDRTSSLAPGFPGPSRPNAHVMHSWTARGRIGRNTLPCHARQPCRCCRCVSERVQAHPARSKSKSTAEPARAPHKQLSTPRNRAEQGDITARSAASVSVEGSNVSASVRGVWSPCKLARAQWRYPFSRMTFSNCR